MTTGLKQRVLYMMANAVPGGAERATMLMIASHDRTRYEPAALFFSQGPLVDDARRLGVEVHVLNSPMRLRHPLSIARTIAESRRLIASGGFSLIHSCMAYAHLIGGATAALSGVPAVMYQHGPLGAWMDGAATLLRCDHILANSEYTATEQRTRSWRARPITVAPYGIDVRVPADQDVARLRAAVDTEHGIAPDATVIGLMARYDPWKGIDVALRAAAPLLRERPKLRFMVVGGQYRHFHPEYGPQLLALVEREGISSQVIFAGFRMDVRPYLARMTVLVHSSLQPEPFGLTIIEAMASGVPVVASGSGGAAEIVEPGVDGLVHSPGNETELRDALRRLLDDPLLRQTFAAAGLRKVDARYRPAGMMRIIEAVYDEVRAA